MSSAECLPSFPFPIPLAAIPVHPPSASALSPIAARSRPAASLSSCGLTSVSVFKNVFSLPHVVPAAPDHTWGVTFDDETPPGPSSPSVGPAWGKAGCLRAAPRHGTLLGAGTPPYLSPRPRCRYIKAAFPAPAVPRRAARLPVGSFLCSHSLCGSLMMKTTGHMKAAPLMRVRGLQATWEVADSTAPAEPQRPSH